jgi:hypothetical protein
MTYILKGQDKSIIIFSLRFCYGNCDDYCLCLQHFSPGFFTDMRQGLLEVVFAPHVILVSEWWKHLVPAIFTVILHGVPSAFTAEQ